MSSNPSTETPSTPTRTSSLPALLRKWWVWPIAGVMLLLILIILLVPVIASSSMVRTRVVARLNDELHGSFKIDDLSMGWSGPSEVTGLTVIDTDGREVLSAAKAKLDAGIWRLITNWEDLGNVNIESVHAELYFDEEGRISLVEALKPVKPSDEPLPEIYAQIHLEDVSATLTRPDGTTYELVNISGDITLDTLSHVTAEIGAELQGGGRLTAKAEVADLLRDGQFSAPDADVRLIDVKTPEPIDAGPLFAFLTGKTDWGGKVSLEVTGDPSRGDLTVRLIEVYSTRRKDAHSAPITMDITGDYAIGDTVAANLTLSGKPGRLTTTFSSPRAEFPPKLSMEMLNRAIIDGDTSTFPEFTFTAKGELDLAELGKLFPEVFKAYSGERIASNRLRVEKLAIRGGRRPTAEGRLVLGGSADGMDVLTQDFSALIEPRRGLKITRADLTSRHGTVRASGDSESYRASFNSTDLAKLRDELARFFELGWLELKGSGSGTLTVRLVDDDLRYSLKANASDFLYSDSKTRQSVRAGSIKVDAGGRLEREKGFPVRLTVDDGSSVELTSFAFARPGESLEAESATFTGGVGVELKTVPGKEPGETELHVTRITSSEKIAIDLASFGFRSGETLSIKAVTATVGGKPTLEFRDGSPSRLAFKEADVDLANFALRMEDRKLDAVTAKVDGDITLDFDDGSPRKLTLAKGVVDVDGRLLVAADGWVDLKTYGFHAAADVKKGDLAHVFGKINGLISPIAMLARWDGTVQEAQSTVAWAGGKSDFIFTVGRATIANPKLDGRGIGAATVTADWKEVRLPRSLDALKIMDVNVDAGVASAKSERFNVAWGKTFSIDGKADVSADLEKSLPVIARVMKREKFPDVRGKIDYAADFKLKGDLITFTGGGTLTDLHVPTGKTRKRIASATLEQSGRIELERGKLGPIRLTKNILNVPDKFEGTVTGTYRVVDHTFDAKVNVTKTDLAFLGEWLAAFGEPGLSRYSGPAAITADLKRTAADAPISSATGKVTLIRPMVDGKPITGRNVTVDWTNARFNPETKAFGVDRVKLDGGTVASVSGTSVKGSYGEKPFVTGELSISADLPTTIPAIERVFKIKNLPKAEGGRLVWSPTFSSDGVTTRLVDKKGTSGSITNLKLVRGSQRFEDRRVKFEFDAEVDPARETLAVKKVTVTSTHFWVSGSGTILKYGTLRHLHNDVKGSYRGSWDRIMPLVYQFYPTLKGNFDPQGPTIGSFALTGTLNHPTAKPPYRYLTGTAQVGWTSAVVYGIPLGKATFTPEIKDSQLVLPLTPVSAGKGAEGRINFAGRLDLTTEPPVLYINKLRAVENLHLTKDFKWDKLGEFFPFFGDLAGVTGIVSVQLDELKYPLSKKGLQQMTGKGTVELVKFRFRPKGLLGILGQIIGLARMGADDMREMPTTLAPFEIKNGRVYYENVVLWIGKDQDMRFSGWVGFDDRINMKVSLPGGLLGKVTGGRMVIHLTGTRQRPIIDPIRMLIPGDIGKDILKGIGDLLGPKKKDDKKGLEGLLDDLLRRRDDK